MKLYPTTASLDRLTDLDHLTTLVTQFEPISLSEIQGAALLNRVDTKYIFGMDQLIAILPELTGHYRALTIDQTRLHRYKTLYFDTSDFTFYAQHHNRIASRYKVRVRKYVDTGSAFFEIKHRTNQRRTVKSRVPIPDLVTRLDDPLIEFTHEHLPCDAEHLEPKLWNEYVRLTLVSKQRPERVTIDLNLKYRWNEACVVLPGLVIVEVKQRHQSQAAEIIHQLRRLGIRPHAYSKYAAGVYSLYDGVKVNNFKPQIHTVNKVIQGMFKNEFAH
jgi:hypothetical protein